MNTDHFRIAFSFAGEKRDFVEAVANLLSARFGQDAILYDKYHEAQFARYDLGIYLPKLYSEQSDLIVPVLCPDYDAKRWTGWEWVHIYGLLTKADGHRVMPSRFEYANADGLSPTSGYIELDHKSPEQFADLILERLAHNEGRPKDYYTKPFTASASVLKTTIPHNLPTLQPFFGREDELKKIADALDPDSRTWGALIDGPGGMGKTSLAVRAAYDASPDVFKKIIFISLKTRELDDDGLRDLSGFLISGLVELFGELARELDRDDLLKLPEDQRPRLLLDALRSTQTLLVLDNLESLTKPERDTLFTFVKKLPPSCKAILTSRGRIGSGAEELILEALSQEAALATLAELATHNPHLAQTSEAERLVLYRETAGKPLLLRWTAGQLGRGHCLTFTDALDFIRSCPEGNDPLEFIFGDLVEDFSEAESEALCALTYFTLPARVEHVASIARLPETDTDRALRSLANRSLAVPTGELNAFTLVPMVADFLRKKKTALVAETGDRLEKHAFDIIQKNGGKTPTGFSILEGAWPVAAAALPRFLAGSNAQLQEICSSLQRFLDFSARLDEWMALVTDAESKAIASNDFLNAGWRAYNAGWVHYLRGQSENTLECASRAEAHWNNHTFAEKEAMEATLKRANSIHLRGLGHRLAENYPASADAFRTVVDLYCQLDPKRVEVAVGLNALANTLKDSGDFDAAEREYNKALQIATEGTFHEEIAYIKGNLMELALDRQDWPSAESRAQEALSLAENLGRKEVIAANSQRLSKALVRQGKADMALPHARRAVEIYSLLGNPDLAAAQAILTECEAALGGQAS